MDSPSLGLVWVGMERGVIPVLVSKSGILKEIAVISMVAPPHFGVGCLPRNLHLTLVPSRCHSCSLSSSFSS